MAGSRAASAREPGQIREEAALSDTARAPRSSLAGADDRRARPRVGFGDGCTVHCFVPRAAMDNVEIIRQLGDRWNRGDIEGALELFHDDAVFGAGEEWPDPITRHGRDDIRVGMEDWRAAWETVVVEVDSLAPHGDKVVVEARWNSRGRLSGLEGTMPFLMVVTLRDGKIAAVEWFTDHDRAVAAARDS
jgi:ketosteroid isomerase-like protein